MIVNLISLKTSIISSKTKSFNLSYNLTSIIPKKKPIVENTNIGQYAKEDEIKGIIKIWVC